MNFILSADQKKKLESKFKKQMAELKFESGVQRVYKKHVHFRQIQPL